MASKWQVFDAPDKPALDYMARLANITALDFGFGARSVRPHHLGCANLAAMRETERVRAHS